MRRRRPRPLLLAGLAAALLLFLLLGGGSSATGDPEIVEIPPGTTLRAMAESLKAHGVIRSRLWFSLLARAGGHDRRLQSGTYSFPRGAGGVVALRALASGRALQLRFTVPEGLTLAEIAALAEAELAIAPEDFLAAARDTGLLREFAIPRPARSFEGFLRPETYFVAKGSSATAVVRTMAAGFRESWDAGWDAAAQALGLDRLGLVTLASIIEGEARADADRALIAGVFRNRLRLGMPLQADATILYAMQLTGGRRKTRLFEKDYAFPSSYNTYLHRGLPPGPVGAPSRKSLEAVVDPAPVPYLYYVAGPDGRHVFSRTYAEHLRAVARVRRMR